MQSFSCSKKQRTINSRKTRLFLDFKLVTCGLGTKLSIRWAGKNNSVKAFRLKALAHGLNFKQTTGVLGPDGTTTESVAQTVLVAIRS